MRNFQDAPLFYSGARGSEEHRRLIAEYLNIDTAELRLLSFFTQPETSGGTSSAYTVSLGVSANAPLEQGRLYRMVPDQNNAQGAVTVNPNDTGAVSVKLLDDTDPWGGALKADKPALLRFDGTDFILLNPHGPCGFYLQDQKAANTQAGTFTSGAWRTRDINTEVYDDGSVVSISSDQFTLVPGTYRIMARAPATDVDRHKIKLRNITDSTDDIIGESAFSRSGGGDVTHAELSGPVTITASKTFEIQHQAQTTQANNGFGIESNFSVVEIYAQVWGERIVPI